MTEPDEDDEAARVRRRAHAYELADRARAEIAAASPEVQAEYANARREAEAAQQDEARYALARRFLEAGGSVNWIEWAVLPPTQQAALAAAGRALRLEQVNAVAAALHARMQAVSTTDPLERAARAAIHEAAGSVT